MKELRTEGWVFTLLGQELVKMPKKELLEWLAQAREAYSYSHPDVKVSEDVEEIYAYLMFLSKKLPQELESGEKP